MRQRDKPAVLLVTRNLPPLVGGMERLMQNAATGLGEYTELTVIGPRGCPRYLPPGTTVYETSSKMLPFLLYSTWLAVRHCRRGRFCVVLGGSGLVGPTLYLLKLLYRVRVGVFLHGLDLVVDSLPYQAVFIPCLRRLDLFIANSRNTRRLAQEKGLSEARIHVINPGTELPGLPGTDQRAAFRQRHGIHFGKVIVFVGRMTRRKGLSGFIRHCLAEILESVPDAGLVVIGENPDDSLVGLGEQDAVLAAARDSGLADHITFLGQVDDRDLLTGYAVADVLVLPLVEVPGDIEGFGMIAVEAAACGTPTVAFDLGGVGDAVSGDNGRLVDAGDYPGFARAAAGILLDDAPGSDSCLTHARRFAWPEYHRQLRALVDRAESPD